MKHTLDVHAIEWVPLAKRVPVDLPKGWLAAFQSIVDEAEGEMKFHIVELVRRVVLERYTGSGSVYCSLI